MTLLQTIILGLVEGVTEFLPISSTAHLIVVSTLLKLPQNEVVSLFEVVIQLGAILAIVVLYWRLVLEHKDLFWKAVVGFLPTALIGLVFHDVVKNVFFHSMSMIGSSLVAVGVVFLVVEWKKLKLTKTLNDLTYQDALVCGVAQSLALMPGVSRAGAVLVTMMLMKYKRSDAAIFSFLLAIPTMAGAAALDIVKTNPGLITGDVVLMLLVGSAVAFVTALVCVKWLVEFLGKNDLSGFAFYRIVIGLGLLIFLR